MRVTPATRRWIAVGAWVLATLLLVLLARTVDLSRVASAVEHASKGWLVVAIIANLAIQPFGALQWHALLPSGATLGRRRTLRIFSLTSVANNTTPSLIGHATGMMLLAAEPTVGLVAAVSVMAVDQIAVGIVKVGLLFAASLTLPLPEWMTRGLAGLAALVAALVAGAFVVARRTKHLELLRRPSRLAAGIGFAVCVKAAEGAAITCVQIAFGMTPTVASVIVVLAASALGSVVPVAPANIGTYEAASYAAYRFLGVAPDTALGIAVIQHVCQLLPAVGAGYVLLSLPRPISRTLPPESSLSS